MAKDIIVEERRCRIARERKSRQDKVACGDGPQVCFAADDCRPQCSLPEFPLQMADDVVATIPVSTPIETGSVLR